jgi:AcrR family transcriptional regulator
MAFSSINCGDGIHQICLVIVFTKHGGMASRADMRAASGTYAGRSSDQRRAERRRRLIEAAADLIGEGGIAAVKVRAVCTRAGLNDRYFYESFPDCDQLLLAVFDHWAAEGVGAVTAAMNQAPMGVRPRTRHTIEAALFYVYEDPRRKRLLLESQATEGLRARRAELVAVLGRLLVDQARELLGEHIAEDRNTKLAALTVVSGVLDVVTTWLRGDLDIDIDHLVEFIVAMILTSAEITTVLDRELADPRPHTRADSTQI